MSRLVKPKVGKATLMQTKHGVHVERQYKRPRTTQQCLDADGWMLTYTGVRCRPMALKVEDVNIHDVAHALSMLCRYNGHTSKFYSVAEHSVLVSRAVPKEYAMTALLHDASEAYLSDIPRPYKHLVPGYKENEREAMAVIFAALFGRVYVEYDEVKNADTAILHDEMAALMGVPKKAGAGLGVKIEGKSWYFAKRMFLERYIELGGKV